MSIQELQKVSGLKLFLWERLPEFEQELPKSSKRVGACDMAHNQDLAAVCFRHSLPGKNSFLTFKCFAAEASLESVPKKYYDTIKKLYDDAQEEGILHVAPGFLIDFDEIENTSEKNMIGCLGMLLDMTRIENMIYFLTSQRMQFL